MAGPKVTVTVDSSIGGETLVSPEKAMDLSAGETAKCPSCGQPMPAMAKAADEQDLEKLASDSPGQVPYVVGDLNKIAYLWHNEDTRPLAEDLLKAWIEHGEPLRKAMATAWLSRAKANLAGLVERGGHPKITLKPSNVATEDTAAHIAPRIETEAHESPRLEAQPEPAPAPVREHPWKGRMKVAGAMAAVAGAGVALSEKQRQERVAASRARWAHAKGRPA